MKLLVLGKGKTGSLVAELAQERGHEVVALDEHDNADASALNLDNLRKLGTEVAIDFTTPTAVLDNIRACAKAKVNMVVGTKIGRASCRERCRSWGLRYHLKEKDQVCQCKVVRRTVKW